MSWLGLYYLSQPFVLALLLALGIAAFGGAVLGRPVWPLVLYLAVFFVFAQSNYGSLDLYRANPVYARGSGQLYYPALCWALLVMLFWAWLGRRFAGAAALPAQPVQRALWAWVLLLLAHVAVAVLLGVPATEALDANGFAWMAWMLPLVLLLREAGRDPGAAVLLVRLLVLAALAKAGFGLVRWALLGGDPSNVYQNYGSINVKLTYFDFCDSLVCLLGAAAAFMQLREPAAPRAWRALCALTVLLAVACVALSYRRTAWAGLALAVPWLLWQLPRRWRWPLLLTLLPLGAAALAAIASQRLSAQAATTTSAAGSFFFDLLGNRFGPESTRLLELRLAWQAYVESPVLGVGAWGRYAHSHLIPWQVGASAGGFLHSGVLHLAMKTGLVGLLLMAALLLAYVHECRQAWAAATAAGRTLLVSSVAGLLFMVPDMLLGTPIPQLRTMQLLGLCLGLPGLVAAATAAQRQALAPARAAAPIWPHGVRR